MRSRPLASSKLVILCCGENPRMATRRKRTAGLGESVPDAVSSQPKRPNFGRSSASDRFQERTGAATRGVLFCLAHGRHFKGPVCHLHLCATNALKNAKRSRVFLEGDSGTSSTYINIFNDRVSLSVPDVTCAGFSQTHLTYLWGKEPFPARRKHVHVQIEK